MKKEKKKELSGIRGWLLLYVIGLFIGLFIILFSTLALLIDLGLLPIMPYIIITIMSALFLTDTICICLIFMKKKKAIIWNLFYLNIWLGILVILYIFEIYATIVNTILFNYSISGVFEDIIGKAILPVTVFLWIRYWHKSRIVKNTFIN